MAKQTRKQKNLGAKSQQQKKTPRDTRRKRPTLKETEAYIKEHNLKVIDPLSDFGFKRLLASERNKDILIHLLNTFIAEDVGVVTEVTYLPTELLGISKDDKFVRFDLYCTNQNGDRFIVEMQNGRQGNYADRLRVYTSLATVNNLDKEDKYYKHIPHVYSINLMGYDMQEFKGRERFFWKVYLKDDDE